MSPSIVGFLRGLFTVVAFAVATYLADAAHLAPVIGTVGAGIVAGLALALEHSFSPDGTALFGAITKR